MINKSSGSFVRCHKRWFLGQQRCYEIICLKQLFFCSKNRPKNKIPKYSKQVDFRNKNRRHLDTGEIDEHEENRICENIDQ